MDPREIAVSFTLSKDEAKRETDQLTKLDGFSKGALWVPRLLAVCWTAQGSFEVFTDHRSVIGWSHLVLGCLNGYIAVAQKLTLARITPDVDTAIRFSEAGIFFDRPAALALPWSSLKSIRESNAAYFLRFDGAAVEPPFEREIAIPAGALGANQVAFWQLSEQMLLGPLRRVSAQLSVDESGAVRRIDAESIVNRSARPSAARARPKAPQTLPSQSG